MTKIGVVLKKHFGVSAPDFADSLARIELLGASLGAVHDGVAAVQLFVQEILSSFLGVFIPRVCYPSAGVQQGCRAHKCVSVPPIGRAGGATASAQDALVQAVEPLALLRGLAVLFAIGGRVARLEPWLHSSTCQSAHDILGSELGSMEFTLAQVKEGLQT